MTNFKQIDKVLDLVAKTGDKVIVVSATQDPYVIMTFQDYDRMVLANSGVNHLTEEELLNKINRDIAVWKAAQEDDGYSLDEFKVDDLDKVPSSVTDNVKKPSENTENIESEEDDKYYIEPVD